MTLRALTPSERRLKGKIIVLYCNMGYQVFGSKNPKTGQPYPNYTCIDESIKMLGCNPRKVILNYLYQKELLDVLNQVEQIYKKWLQNG